VSDRQDSGVEENPPGQNPDDALLACVPIHNPGTFYASGSRQWQGIPGIEQAANGRLWATWYSGGAGEGPDNYCLLVTSEADGKPWSSPVIVIDPPGYVRAFDPLLWTDPTGRLWFFWAQSYHMFDGRAGVWAIHTDHPERADCKWSSPRRICDGIMMNKPTVTRDGHWLLPAAIWSYENVPRNVVYHPAMEGLRNSWVVRSTDNGKTFSRIGGSEVPQRTADEHMIVERNDGSLWMLVRTRYGIGESFSHDAGVTWSPGQPSTIAGPVSRFFIRRLRSGRLLLVNHHAFTKRNNLAAMLSDDDGKTWHGMLMLDARNDVSYPDGVEGPDGYIRVIYDRSRYGEKEILMACFTETDILNGLPVSPHSRLRVLIDTASAR
jgi:predicted neuraminidase